MELMSKETVEKMETIENITKKQVMEAIKASKKELDSSEQKETDSIQNIVKENTIEIIEKIDSKIPTYVKMYSDLYKKYLHIASNFCNTSYLTQKEFFEKMGIDDAMFDAYLESVKKMVLFQIDMNESMIQSYVGNRLTVLDFYDQMMNGSIANFAKMFSMFDNFKK